MSESPFRSPFAALVWKEWRELWWLLVLVVIGPAAWTIVLRISLASSATRVLKDMFSAIGVCGLTLGLAAALFASERMRGTDAFQHERPVGRGTIWNAKLLLPVLAVASGAILFGIVAFWLWPMEHWRQLLGTVVPLLMLIIWFLSFASAVLCSVLLDRPLTAGAAGGVLCIGTVCVQFSLFDHFIGLEGQSNNWHWPMFLFLLVVEVIGLLWLSRVIFIRSARD